MDQVNKRRAPSYAPVEDGAQPEIDERPGASSTTSSVHQRKRSLWRETLIVVVSALVLSMVIKTFLLQSFYIPSASMQPTLDIGDRIMVNKVAASRETIHRGDIVVFTDPGGWLPPRGPDTRSGVTKFFSKMFIAVGLGSEDNGTHLVKRVIGKSGDRVSCCTDGGLLQINGQAIQEQYINPATPPSELEFDVTVPPGYIWVMGDNRSNSEDSRAHILRAGGGFVPEANVTGRAFLITWPLGRFGYLSNPGNFENVPDAP